MAIDNRLQIFDENGNPVDYDIMATDVKFADGKDLPTKLDELEDEIGESQGGYTPPPGGIPKTDLAPAVQQTLDDVANKVDKVTGYGLSKNDYTDTDKAKVNSLKTVATSGSYNDLTDKPTIPTVPTMDSTPTAGNTTHMVSSDGVAAAIAGKANAADVPTKTEMADAIDDALGEAQVTVVPASSVGIISSLGSDSDSDALSAAMGKKLKVALLQIFSSLGSYAFPNGKPTLDFDDIVTYSVQKTIGVGLSATGGSTEVLAGYPLEMNIAITNNLYVVDDDSVVVTMGGQPVAGAWNASTMKVTIAAVTGNVVINVPSLTYVQRGLVLHLDGKNGRSVAHRWDSLVNYNSNPLYFKLENCDEQSDYVGFDKDDNSCGIAYSDAGFQNQVTLLDVHAASGTIEFAATGMDEVENVCIMHNNIGQGNRILFAIIKLTNDSTIRNVTYCTSPLSTATNGGKLYATGVKQGYFSALSNSVKVNGTDLEMYPASSEGVSSFVANASSYLALLRRHADSASPVDAYYSANLYALRVYSVQLTDAERAQNLAIDRKRFNLGY